MAENVTEADTREFGDVYADRTVLVDALGSPTKIRTLAVLISESDRDLSPSEICEQAGIGSSSFYHHIEDLLAYDLVKRTRNVGNSPMYQINTDSGAAEALASFEWNLLEFLAEKEEAGEVDENGRPMYTDE